jgi:hypothetical protein
MKSVIVDFVARVTLPRADVIDRRQDGQQGGRNPTRELEASLVEEVPEDSMTPLVSRGTNKPSSGRASDTKHLLALDAVLNVHDTQTPTRDPAAKQPQYGIRSEERRVV